MNDGPELGDDSDLLFMVNDGIEDVDGMSVRKLFILNNDLVNL